MRPNKQIEKWFAELKAKPSAGLDARVHRAIDEALAQRNQIPPAGFLPPKTWTPIMKILMTKWTAAAVVAAAMLMAGILVLDKTAPSAFGLERVIAACKGVRFLHVKSHQAKEQEPNEFWIASDDSGHVVKARYYLPVTEDGVKLITWTPQGAEIWFKSKHGYLTLEANEIEKWMQSLLEQSQPEVVTEKLLAAQQAHQAAIRVQQPTDKEKPIMIMVTRKNDPATKQVYWIDQKTELINSMETYHTEGDTDVLKSWTEFLDYNVPIDDQMFSLRDQLPADVSIADQLNQVSGLAQGNLTDEQAAAQTARAFFQALLNKDYKQAGLVMGGELEPYVTAEFGQLNVTAIVSVGPALLQPNWVKRGYKVPCEVEITHPNGQKAIWHSAPYVRPGDDKRHPDHWNITGGVSAAQAGIQLLPDNKMYEQMTPKQAAEAFFQACATKNWDEVAKFWPLSPADEKFQRMKEYLGGLQVISIGEPYQSNNYPGWYVPYEIKLPPQEINIRVSNTNAARRYVVTGVFDSKLQPAGKTEWTNEPETLANNDPYARMSPAEVVRAYCDALTNADWVDLRKLIPDADVEHTRQQFAEAQKLGADLHKLLPAVEVGEAVWSPAQSAWFVKCRAAGVKKWNLAVRNDNAANRYLFDGGL